MSGSSTADLVVKTVHLSRLHSKWGYSRLDLEFRKFLLACFVDLEEMRTSKRATTRTGEQYLGTVPPAPSNLRTET